MNDSYIIRNRKDLSQHMYHLMDYNPKPYGDCLLVDDINLIY